MFLTCFMSLVPVIKPSKSEFPKPPPWLRHSRKSCFRKHVRGTQEFWSWTSLTKIKLSEASLTLTSPWMLIYIQRLKILRFLTWFMSFLWGTPKPGNCAPSRLRGRFRNFWKPHSPCIGRVLLISRIFLHIFFIFLHITSYFLHIPSYFFHISFIFLIFSSHSVIFPSYFLRLRDIEKLWVFFLYMWALRLGKKSEPSHL